MTERKRSAISRNHVYGFRFVLHLKKTAGEDDIEMSGNRKHQVMIKMLIGWFVGQIALSYCLGLCLLKTFC